MGDGFTPDGFVPEGGDGFVEDGFAPDEPAAPVTGPGVEAGAGVMGALPTPMAGAAGAGNAPAVRQPINTRKLIADAISQQRAPQTLITDHLDNIYKEYVAPVVRAGQAINRVTAEPGMEAIGSALGPTAEYGARALSTLSAGPQMMEAMDPTRRDHAIKSAEDFFRSFAHVASARRATPEQERKFATNATAFSEGALRQVPEMALFMAGDGLGLGTMGSGAVGMGSLMALQPDVIGEPGNVEANPTGPALGAVEGAVFSKGMELGIKGTVGIAKAAASKLRPRVVGMTKEAATQVAHATNDIINGVEPATGGPELQVLMDLSREDIGAKVRAGRQAQAAWEARVAQVGVTGDAANRVAAENIGTTVEGGKYAIDTIDRGKLNVTITRNADGSATIERPGYKQEAAGSLAQGKTDKQLLEYYFEPTAIKPQSAAVTPIHTKVAQDKIARPTFALVTHTNAGKLAMRLVEVNGNGGLKYSEAPINSVADVVAQKKAAADLGVKLDVLNAALLSDDPLVRAFRIEPSNITNEAPVVRMQDIAIKGTRVERSLPRHAPRPDGMKQLEPGDALLGRMDADGVWSLSNLTSPEARRFSLEQRMPVEVQGASGKKYIGFRRSGAPISPVADEEGMVLISPARDADQLPNGLPMHARLEAKYVRDLTTREIDELAARVPPAVHDYSQRSSATRTTKELVAKLDQLVKDDKKVAQMVSDYFDIEAKAVVAKSKETDPVLAQFDLMHEGAKKFIREAKAQGLSESQAMEALREVAPHAVTDTLHYKGAGPTRERVRNVLGHMLGLKRPDVTTDILLNLYATTGKEKADPKLIQQWVESMDAALLSSKTDLKPPGELPMELGIELKPGNPAPIFTPEQAKLAEQARISYEMAHRAGGSPAEVEVKLGDITAQAKELGLPEVAIERAQIEGLQAARSGAPPSGGGGGGIPPMDPPVPPKPEPPMLPPPGNIPPNDIASLSLLQRGGKSLETIMQNLVGPHARGPADLAQMALQAAHTRQLGESIQKDVISRLDRLVGGTGKDTQPLRQALDKFFRDPSAENIAGLNKFDIAKRDVDGLVAQYAQERDALHAELVRLGAIRPQESEPGKKVAEKYLTQVYYRRLLAEGQWAGIVRNDTALMREAEELFSKTISEETLQGLALDPAATKAERLARAQYIISEIIGDPAVQKGVAGSRTQGSGAAYQSFKSRRFDPNSGELAQKLNTFLDQLHAAQAAGDEAEVIRILDEAKGLAQYVRVVKKLLGNSTDGVVNMGITLGRQKTLVAELNMWNEVAMNPEWISATLTDEAGKAREGWTLLEKDSQRYGNAAGKYISPQAREALIDYPANMQKLTRQFIGTLTSAWKSNAVTLGGMGPWVNNLLGQVQTSILCGGLDVFHPVQTGRSLLNTVRFMMEHNSMPGAAGNEGGRLIEAARRFGIDAPGWMELELSGRQRAMVERLAQDPNKSRMGLIDFYKLLAPQEAGGKPFVRKAAGALYDGVDRFFKLANWLGLMEKGGLIGERLVDVKAASRFVGRDMSNFSQDAIQEAVMRKAAHEVALSHPMPDMVGTTVDQLRHGAVGIANPFLTYNSEMLRVYGHIPQRLKDNPDFRLRMLKHGLLAANLYIGLKALRKANGISDEEVDWRKQNLNKASLQWRPGLLATHLRSKDGGIVFWDLTQQFQALQWMTGNPEASAVGRSVYNIMKTPIAGGIGDEVMDQTLGRWLGLAGTRPDRPAFPEEKTFLGALDVGTRYGLLPRAFDSTSRALSKGGLFGEPAQLQQRDDPGIAALNALGGKFVTSGKNTFITHQMQKGADEIRLEKGFDRAGGTKKNEYKGGFFQQTLDTRDTKTQRMDAMKEEVKGFKLRNAAQNAVKRAAKENK